MDNRELKEGYKQTDAGIIPEDWDLEILENLSTAIGDGIHSTPKYVDSSEFYFINGNNLVDNAIRITENTKCVSGKEYRKYQLKLNDKTILLSINGTIGNLAYYNNEPVILGKSAAYISTKKSTSKEFIFYLLQTETIKQYFEDELTGSTIRNLSLKSIRNTPIKLPPLPEQQAIAEVLSDVDALVTSLDQLITKKRNIKQGAMQLLLTGKKRLLGFSGDWETKTLGEVCSYINDGTHHTPNYVENGVPFYSVENVTANNFSDTKFITKQAHAIQIKRCKPEKGDILLTRIGSLGQTKLIDWDVNASIYVSLALLKVNDKVNAEYLYSYTKSRQFIKDVESRSLLNAIPQKINMGDISKVPILVPPTKEEQKAIAQILSEMDAEIEALETQQAKYKAIKQGMMQELLTGKTRLIN